MVTFASASQPRTSFHLGQDVIGGAVEDAFHLRNRGAREGLPDQVEEGCPRHHRSLVEELHAVSGRKVDQLVREQGERALVGGRHVHAAGQSSSDVVCGRLAGLDVGVSDLQHGIGFGLVDHRQGVHLTAAVRVLGDRAVVGHHRHDLFEIEPIRVLGRALEHVDDAGDLPVETEASVELLFLFDQELGEPLGHGAETDE
jgi:hypothetical protein